MKTTIDIPEALYMKAKIRAVETKQTLRGLVLTSLQRELDNPAQKSTPQDSFWARRKLIPEYERALKDGAFSDGTDSSTLLSEERTSRENSLL